MLEAVCRNGIHLIEAPSLEARFGVRAVFTGRDGGSSLGPFSSFNLSYNVGDNRNDVASNRDRLQESMGISLKDWVFCRQVHGVTATVVGPLQVGRGSTDISSAIPGCDSLVTRLERVVLAVLTADCAPVVMIAPGGNVVSVTHMGWRGALAGVVTVALGKLTGTACCPPGGVIALIGPHIGACCMEVAGDVAQRFRVRFGDEVVVGRPPAVAVDLGAACRRELEAAGVMSGSIFDTDICTRCNDSYFSYRGHSGTTGRQAGLVAISRPPGTPHANS